MKEPLFLQTQAYDYLITQIKDGTLRPDTIYSLNQMAKEIGISPAQVSRLEKGALDKIKSHHKITF